MNPNSIDDKKKSNLISNNDSIPNSSPKNINSNNKDETDEDDINNLL
jgi:hypothetical protein